MFKQAQIKLTIFYSILFLGLFWLFSLGIYAWMDRSFGEGYISQVIHKQQSQSVGELDDTKTAIATVAGDVALDQLKNVLLILNGGLFIMIPIATWFWVKRTLSPIQRIHEQQKQFVSDASHEMRTPLAIMSGEIEVALKKSRTIKDYKQTLISSKEEIDQLTALVENLLFLAREDQGQALDNLETVDITDLIGGIIARFKSQIQEKQLDVQFIPPKDGLTLSGSQSMLKQLFLNLIENALKYTPGKGKVWIKLKPIKGFLEVSIQDTGPGIALQDQEKIFDRFYRIDSSRSQKQGYGLGLAISQAIAKRHQGVLTVNSKLGQGSKFSVILPLN